MATNEGSSLILQYYPVAEVDFVRRAHVCIYSVNTPMDSLVFTQARHSRKIRRRGHFLNEDVKQPIAIKLNDNDVNPPSPSLRFPIDLPALKLDNDGFPPFPVAPPSSIDPSTLSGVWCLVERGWTVGMHREEKIGVALGTLFFKRRYFGPRPFIGCASASASVECTCLSSSLSVVFGMYSATYLLCQLTCAWEARRVCGGRGTRVNLCSTSTECTRFITHLSFETDVGAHTERCVCARSAEHHYTRGARREMDLRGSRPDVPFPSASSSAGHDLPLTQRLGTRVSSLDVTRLERGRVFTVGTEERKVQRERTIPRPLLRFKTCAGSWDDMRREMDVRETSDESKHQRPTV
ncbi:hypothetical protein EV421DRAFT_1906379 [Armillaria borealis]|uniref:Uncharacterized protein n=1 Tax=Armillaria borealis TaxID=47425 RepID=A0AA39MLX9_9AGAR|nr:hypothetical protein EV421DRAFT_1906379 [Armillaria borealis]